MTTPSGADQGPRRDVQSRRTAFVATSARRSTTAGRRATPDDAGGDESAAAARHDRDDPAGAHDHRAQRLAGHPVHPVDQSVPGLRARLHLLLRAADARVSRPVAGPRLRDEAVREAQRRRAAARGAREARLRLRSDRARHQHRPVPADRARVEGHAARSSRCSPSASIRSRSSPSRRWSSATSTSSRRWRRRTWRASAISITTLDRDLARKLEPRAAAPQRRLQAMRRARRRRHSGRRAWSRRSFRSSTTRTSKRSSKPRRQHGATTRRLGDAAPAARGRAAVPRLARRRTIRCAPRT